MRFTRFAARWSGAAAAAVLLVIAPPALATPPTADFTWSPTVPLVGQSVGFNASASATTDGATISSYSWSFGASTASASTSFSSNGIKNVSLTVTDSNGESVTVAHDLRVNAAPVASFGFSPTVPNVTGQPNATVSFDASGSSDDQPGLSYAWTFGDGSSGSGSNPTHAYSSGGNKSVKLTVTDSDGVPISQTQNVRVNFTPTAGFVCAGFDTNPPASAPSGTAFVNQQIGCYGGPPSGGQPGSSDPDGNGTITGFAWDLGIGTFGAPTASNSIVKNPGFDTAGDKTFRLKVTDNNGATSPEASSTVKIVDRPPVVTFTFDPQTPKTGETVAFAATATDPDGASDITSIAWDLGSGSDFADATGPTAKATYTSAGDYHVRVKVTDKSGMSTVADKVVPVRDTIPDAGFTFTPAQPHAGEAIALTSTTTASPGRSITNLEWDVDGDGKFGDVTGPAVTVTFLNPGAHTVSLRATEQPGNGVDIVSQVIQVLPAVAQGGVAGTSASGFPVSPASASTASVGRGLSVVSGVRVSVSGSVTIRGTRIIRLIVNAPSGATVRVSCAGRGCPKKVQRAKAGRRPLRFRALERTFLPGTRITVLVTKAGFIGKQVQFRIRQGRAPVRTELCLTPGTKKAKGCPA